jgi:CheY-like chemotaxis protein
MSVVKRNTRKRNSATSQTVKKRRKTKSAVKQDVAAVEASPVISEDRVLEPSSDPSINVIEQPSVTSRREVNPDETTVEGWELYDLLLQFTANNKPDSTPKREVESDECTRFQIVDEASYQSSSTEGEPVDPSKWFDHEDANSTEDSAALAVVQHETAGSDETSFDPAGSRGLENIPDDSIDASASSSEAGSADETVNEVVESTADHASQPPQVERRRQPRQKSSDLVWIEYFDSSLESIGKEAARADNFGGGGMRLAVKVAPPDLEKVIVSNPSRGFESCAIVRGRYQAEDGDERLCLEFADRQWKANATCTREENSVGQLNPRRKILLADDDSTFRKILGDILTRAGYDVVLAEDGEKAVEKATTENPAVVITDGLMPKLHGFEVSKAIKELNPETKIIMLTAIYTSPNSRREAHSKFHVDELITKPCQIADLLSKIEKHMPRLSSGA